MPKRSSATLVRRQRAERKLAASGSFRAISPLVVSDAPQMSTAKKIARQCRSRVRTQHDAQLRARPSFAKLNRIETVTEICSRFAIQHSKINCGALGAGRLAVDADCRNRAGMGNPTSSSARRLLDRHERAVAASATCPLREVKAPRSALREKLRVPLA